MPKTSAYTILILLIVALIAVTGCSDGERVANVATEAAEQQSKQNVEMAQLNREVAEGTKRLVEADATARQEITAMQHDVQTEHAKVSQQRDQLETERKEIAGQRLTESRLEPILKSCSIVALGVVTIGFCWYLLFGLRHYDRADELLNELLIDEMVSDRSMILPREPSATDLANLPPEHSDRQRLPTPD